MNRREFIARLTAGGAAVAVAPSLLTKDPPSLLVEVADLYRSTAPLPWRTYHSILKKSVLSCDLHLDFATMEAMQKAVGNGRSVVSFTFPDGLTFQGLVDKCSVVYNNEDLSPLVQLDLVEVEGEDEPGLVLDPSTIRSMNVNHEYDQIDVTTH